MSEDVVLLLSSSCNIGVKISLFSGTGTRGLLVRVLAFQLDTVSIFSPAFES